MTKIFVIFVFIAFVSAVYGQKPSFLGSGQKPICVNNGDYCKDNTDCCSKSCTSSKCMTSNLITTSTNDVNLANQQQPNLTTTLDNRFNEDEAKNCQGKSKKCSSSLKCCDFLSCEKNFCRDKSVFVSGTETLGYNKPTQQELDNRFNENESEISSPPAPAKCMDIGQKCYTPGECCAPLKCHSFLHQCVT